MNKPVPHWHEQLRTWFDQQRADQELAGRIWERACVSDWRRFPDGRFGPDHPERGLILHWICRNRAVTRALQVETGRGYACAAMALDTSQAGVNIKIDALDPRPANQRQSWTIRHEGTDQALQLSVEEVIANYLPDLAEVITHHAGPTHKQLYRLLKEGAHYDLIVLSARNTPYDLVRDLCYCIPMLEDDGAIVFEQFAPTTAPGLGGIMLVPHIRRLFVDISLYATHGKVWPTPLSALERQNMVVASGHRFPEWRLRKSRLLLWKLASWFMCRVYRNGPDFPLQPDVD